MRLTQRIAGWFQRAPSAHPQPSVWRQPRFERLEDRLVLSHSPAAAIVVPPDGGSDATVVDPKPPAIEAPPTILECGEGQPFPDAVDTTEPGLLETPDEATAPIDNACEPAHDKPCAPADDGQLVADAEPAQPLSDEVCLPDVEPCSCDVQVGPDLLADPSSDAVPTTDEGTVLINLDCDLHPLPVQRDVGEPADDGSLGPIEGSGTETPPCEMGGDDPAVYLEDWGPPLEMFPVLTAFGDTGESPEVVYFSTIPASVVDGSPAADPSPYTHGWFVANLSPSPPESMFSGPGRVTHGQGLPWDRQDSPWPQVAPAPDAHDAALLAYIHAWNSTDGDHRLGRVRAGTGGLLPLDTSLTVWRDAALDKLADAAKLDEGLLSSADLVREQDEDH